MTHPTTLHTRQVLETECVRTSLDGLDEAGFYADAVVGGVAVTAQPLHPGMGEWENEEWNRGSRTCQKSRHG